VAPRLQTAAALCAALLCAAPAARAGGVDVSLTRRPDKAYEVRGAFTVAVSTEAVWSALTDYERIPTFVSSMRASRVRGRRGDGTILVEQEAVGRMFFVSRGVRTLLEVRRDDDRLRFTDVSRRDFSVYDGEWAARTAADGVHVSYHLILRPRATAPAFLLGRAVKRGARELLDQVRVEIARRASAR
jgi:hypothetical protein